jgi:hypothetical protein
MFDSFDSAQVTFVMTILHKFLNCIILHHLWKKCRVLPVLHKVLRLIIILFCTGLHFNYFRCVKMGLPELKQLL